MKKGGIAKSQLRLPFAVFFCGLPAWTPSMERTGSKSPMCSM